MARTLGMLPFSRLSGSGSISSDYARDASPIPAHGRVAEPCLHVLERFEVVSNVAHRKRPDWIVFFVARLLEEASHRLFAILHSAIPYVIIAITIRIEHVLELGRRQGWGRGG